MIVEKSVRRFIRDLASSRPVPGGGNVSAVVAAQAAGLVAMACLISLKRAAGLRRKRLRSLAAEAQVAAELGLGIAEWDAAVFSRLMTCVKKRYASPAARLTAVQRSLLFCTAACVDLSILAGAGMRLTSEAARHVKGEMRSELRTALGLWDAAFEGSRINAEANLAWIRQVRVKQRARALIRQVAAQVRRDRARTLKALGKG